MQIFDLAEISKSWSTVSNTIVIFFLYWLALNKKDIIHFLKFIFNIYSLDNKPLVWLLPDASFTENSY